MPVSTDFQFYSAVDPRTEDKVRMIVSDGGYRFMGLTHNPATATATATVSVLSDRDLDPRTIDRLVEDVFGVNDLEYLAQVCMAQAWDVGED